MPQVLKQLLGQVSKFTVVGAVATAVHIAVATALIHAGAATPFVANLCAFLTAVSISFLGHYHWSFSCQAQKGRAFARFFAVALLAMAVNNACLKILILLDWFAVGVSVVLAALVVPVLSFVLSKIWAFAPETKA